MTEDLRYKPVLAFDVDGVLRVNAPGFPLEESLLIDVTMNKDNYPEIFHGKPKWDALGEYRSTQVFAKTGVNFLKELQRESDSAEPVFATTWQRWANEYFVEPLGLNPLPVAVKTLKPFERNYSHCSPSWKTGQLSRQFDGRPLAWIDDNMPDRAGELLEELRRPEDRHLTLSYRVNPQTGLTARDVSIIREWMKLASTPDGQEELRLIELERVEREKMSVEERRAVKALENEIYRETLAKARELFPRNTYLSSNLASLSVHRDGLTVETLEYALKRNNTKADPVALGEALRREGYHYKDLDEVDAAEFA